MQTGRDIALVPIAFCRIAAKALWFSALAVAPVALAAPSGAPGGELQAGLPTEVCGARSCGPAQRRIWARFERGARSCGPAQRRIWARFERGEGLDRAAVPGVYAGVCYVQDDLYAPDREHHVGFLIDEFGGRPHLFLRFSFFTAANPFDGLDVDAARIRLVDTVLPEPVLPMALYGGHAYAGYFDRQFFARYWFRRDPATGRVLLVSYFGYRMTILCDAVRNAL